MDRFLRRSVGPLDELEEEPAAIAMNTMRTMPIRTATPAPRQPARPQPPRIFMPLPPSAGGGPPGAPMGGMPPGIPPGGGP